MATPFNQGAPTIPVVLNTSNCFVFGNTASGNALSVQQLGTGNVATFRTTTGATALFVNAAGNVGVGTTNPNGTTHVWNAAATGGPKVSIGDNTAFAPGGLHSIAALTSTLGAGNGNSIILGRTNATNDAFQMTFMNVAQGSTTNYLGLNAFGAASTALAIQASGRVGIGTTDPKGTFNVLSGNAGFPDTTGSGSSNVAARIQSGSICLDFGSIGGTNPFWIQNHLSTNNATNYPILLNPNGGNVGIGTTNPGYALQVNGSIGMVGGTIIPLTLPLVGSQTSYSINLAASGTWYTVISDARINATITGAIGVSDLTSTIFIATLYANGGANASMVLVTGSASNIRVSGTALQFNAVSGLYGRDCNFTLLRHN